MSTARFDRGGDLALGRRGDAEQSFMHSSPTIMPISMPPTCSASLRSRCRAIAAAEPFTSFGLRGFACAHEGARELGRAVASATTGGAWHLARRQAELRDPGP